VGLAVMIGLFPVMGVILFVLVKHTKAKLKFSDVRVRLVNEILQAIRVVKFYAWEQSFGTRIFDVRNKELEVLKKLLFTRSLMFFVFMLMPVLVSFATFGSYVALGNVLEVATVFKAVAFFNALRFPLISLPSAITNLIAGKVSAKRIQKFLELPELTGCRELSKQFHKAELKTDDKTDKDTEYALRIVNGVLKWDPDQAEPTLQGINVNIKKGM